MKPKLIVLAGSNGAGKSTFYQSFLKNKGLPFINADIIARELKLDAYEAASIANQIRIKLCEQRQSFIMETVFSDPRGEKLEQLKAFVSSGYEVTVFFIGINSIRQSLERVSARVRAGGHDVPKDKLHSRFERTLKNLNCAIKELPRVILYDNSHKKSPYRFLMEFRNGEKIRSKEGKIPKWAMPFAD